MNTSIRHVINAGAETLNSAGIKEPRMEAVSILGHIIGRDRTFMIAHADDDLAEEHVQTFDQLVTRRAKGEPLQYLTGHQEFFKLEFEVAPGVLIPRPETEIIVEAALEVSRNEVSPFILDVGTGSGCIVVSLLDELRNARGVATDISKEALYIARRNAQRHQVIDRLTLVQTNGLSAFPKSPAFSLIVSNPPYIREDEIEGLQREVRDHEPLAALVSGADGLSHIRDLLREAASHLRKGGYFIFEIGFGQREAVSQMVDPDQWELIGVKKDLQQIARTFVLKKI